MTDQSLSVDSKNPLPPYAQVRQQLEYLICAGILHAGDRLPPLRQLAGDLGLAVGTVGRAYAELEEKGLVVSRRGAGTRVADDVQPTPDAVLDRLVSDFLQRVRAIGVEPRSALEALESAVRDPKDVTNVRRRP